MTFYCGPLLSEINLYRYFFYVISIATVFAVVLLVVVVAAGVLVETGAANSLVTSSVASIVGVASFLMSVLKRLVGRGSS